MGRTILQIGILALYKKKMEDNNQYHPDNMLPDGTINTQLQHH
jgi:hypothetical protein